MASKSLFLKILAGGMLVGLSMYSACSARKAYQEQKHIKKSLSKDEFKANINEDYQTISELVRLLNKKLPSSPNDEGFGILNDELWGLKSDLLESYLSAPHQNLKIKDILTEPKVNAKRIEGLESLLSSIIEKYDVEKGELSLAYRLLFYSQSILELKPYDLERLVMEKLSQPNSEKFDTGVLLALYYENQLPLLSSDQKNRVRENIICAIRRGSQTNYLKFLDEAGWDGAIEPNKYRNEVRNAFILYAERNNYIEAFNHYFHKNGIGTGLDIQIKLSDAQIEKFKRDVEAYSIAGKYDAAKFALSKAKEMGNRVVLDQKAQKQN